MGLECKAKDDVLNVIFVCTLGTLGTKVGCFLKEHMQTIRLPSSPVR